MNFNANSSECYTLHVSNEHTEMSLEPEQISTASNFEVELNPPLDLGQLSFLQSPDIEVRIQFFFSFFHFFIFSFFSFFHFFSFFFIQVRVETVLIDSAPLLLRADPNEKIKTFVKLAPRLARDNIILSPKKLDIRNKIPLEVNLSDFYTTDVHHAIRHINTLLSNGSNLFLIAKYSELFLDHHGLFNYTVFKGLDSETIVDVTKADMDLLLRYIDIGFFARMEMIRYLNGFIDENRDISTLVPWSVTYNKTSMSHEHEEDILITSKYFNSIADRSAYIIDDGTDAEPLKLIDLQAYYDIDLKTKRKKGELFEANANRISANKQLIKDRLWAKLEIIGKATLAGRKFDAKSALYAEEIIHNNIELLKIGRKIRDMIVLEMERLAQHSESRLFSRPFAALGLDVSETKARFYLEFSKLCEHCHISIIFSPILSYKLGSSRDLTTQKYNMIRIGPVSLADQNDNTTGVAHKIVSSKQRLSASLRIFPKLLIIASDILSEQSRQMEKEQTFFVKNDMVSFFKVQLKAKSIGSQFLAVEASKLPSQPFFRVHRARTYLSTFKIMLFDENGEFLLFPRDSIVKLALTFRPSPLHA